MSQDYSDEAIAVGDKLHSSNGTIEIVDEAPSVANGMIKWTPQKLGGNAKQRRWINRYYEHVRFEYNKMEKREAKLKESQKL